MDGVILTPLKVIPHPKGDVLHALKCVEESFFGFGEAYFTKILHSETKGWKLHERMALNLVVPVGSVRFYVRSEAGIAKKYDLGVDHYSRLTIAPGYWVAFRGLSDGLNLVLNVASIPHDPSESRNLPLDAFSFE